MPELPEVEVVRSGLAPALADATVSVVTVLDSRALTRHPGSVDEFERVLTGARVRAVCRRGKFLWMPFETPVGSATPRAIVAHLGMSGQMLLRPTGAPAERHERIRLDIEHPRHGALAVVFADQRTFGSLALDTLLPTPDAEPGGVGSPDPTVPGQVAHIARDALDPAFDETLLRRVLARKRSGIKRVLLDQTVVSGIGNIYADEALWGARIHPETPADSLSVRRVTRLLDEIRAVLHRALAEGGTSFDAQYVNVNGQAGYFAHSLHAYGRTAAPCHRCTQPIVRVSFMNRSSHYCPRCQRMPRTR